MKNQFNKLFLASAATLALASCSDDFLEQAPLSFYEPGVTYTTEKGLESAMGKCDLHLRNIILNGGSNDVPMATNYYFTDIATHGKTDLGDGFPDNMSDKITPTSGMGGGGDNNAMMRYWDEGYKGVMLANTVLDYIDKVEGLDEKTRNTYKGRALFHRAMKYYHLVLQFGDIPLVTKLVSSPKQDYHTTSKEAIFQMLVEDLEFAVANVPSQQEMTYRGMVNKEACIMLLAKCYLVTGQYDKAEQQCTDLINNYGLQLMQAPFGTFIPSLSPETHAVTDNVMWDLFRGENVATAENRECIMPILNFDPTSFTTNFVMRAVGVAYDNGSLMAPDGKRGMTCYARNSSDYMATEDWTRAMGRGIGGLHTSWWFNKSIWTVEGELDEQDLRHNREVGNWIDMEDMTYNHKETKYRGQHLQLYATEDYVDESGTVIKQKGDLLCSDTIRCWYPTPLYKMWILDAENESNMGATQFQGATTGSNNNMYLFRLAETYLVRAEARFYQGNTAGATDDVNTVRARSNAKKMFGTVTIGDIVDERARELYFEEWRQAELARVSWCLAKSGKPDELGETYDIGTWDKQEGTDLSGGSYWYKRCTRCGSFNHGTTVSGGRTFNFVVNKHNIFWPIPNSSITANKDFPLCQNYGYDGYDPAGQMWTDWHDAAAAE